MRRYQVEGAYEMLKDFTRGKDINADTMQEFINELPIADDVKTNLKALTPEKYIGLAKQLTDLIK